MEITRVSSIDKFGIILIIVILFCNISLAVRFLPENARQVNKDAEILISHIQASPCFDYLASLQEKEDSFDSEDASYYAELESQDTKEASLVSSPEASQEMVMANNSLQKTYSNGQNTTITYTEADLNSNLEPSSPIYSYLHQEGVYFIFVVLVALGFCVAGLQMYRITRQEQDVLPPLPSEEQDLSA